MFAASTLHGFAIHASDGDIGHVTDFLFDDDNWRVRWLVVDTGHFLPGRKVLLHPSALGAPDPVARRLPVQLTMEQVRSSPDIELHQPVSRQLETELFTHYGWDPFWGDNIWLSLAAEEDTPMPSDPGPTISETAGRTFGDNDDDPRLRSIQVVCGDHVHATDGDIGHIETMLLDEAGWRIAWLVIDTRNWWPGRQVLVPPQLVTDIDWLEEHVSVRLTRAEIKASPLYDPRDVPQLAARQIAARQRPRDGEPG